MIPVEIQALKEVKMSVEVQVIHYSGKVRPNVSTESSWSKLCMNSQSF